MCCNMFVQWPLLRLATSSTLRRSFFCGFKGLSHTLINLKSFQRPPKESPIGGFLRLIRVGLLVTCSVAGKSPVRKLSWGVFQRDSWVGCLVGGELFSFFVPFFCGFLKTPTAGWCFPTYCILLFASLQAPNPFWELQLPSFSNISVGCGHTSTKRNQQKGTTHPFGLLNTKK